MIRAYADNVVLRLLPRPTETASGIALVQTGKAGAREHRTAVVIASGPGYYTRLGALVANTVRAGDTVVVDALAGQNYDLDLSVPRHNTHAEFEALGGERGEWRIVREQEILAVIAEGVEMAAE